MTCPINPNVKIDETDTRVHIGISCFPNAFDTVRFTPLTVEGREILRIGTDRKRVSCGLQRGYELYDWLGSIGIATRDEVLDSPDSKSRFDNAGYAASSGYDGD